VETRDKADDRATKSAGPGLFPVDTRDKSTVGDRPSIPLKEQLFLNGEKERFEMLKRAAEAVTGQTLFDRSSPARRLEALAQRLTHEQAAMIAAELRRRTDRLYFPKVVDVALDLSTEPSIKRAGRAEPYLEGGPEAIAL
jgi:hypothetical protein